MKTTLRVLALDAIDYPIIDENIDRLVGDLKFPTDKLWTNFEIIFYSSRNPNSYLAANKLKDYYDSKRLYIELVDEPRLDCQDQNEQPDQESLEAWEKAAYRTIIDCSEKMAEGNISLGLAISFNPLPSSVANLNSESTGMKRDIPLLGPKQVWLEFVVGEEKQRWCKR